MVPYLKFFGIFKMNHFGIRNKSLRCTRHMMDKVLNRSILTLLYRAMPPPPGSNSTFTPECVDAARSALEKHEECMERLKPYDAQLRTLYLHW